MEQTGSALPCNNMSLVIDDVPVLSTYTDVCPLLPVTRSTWLPISPI